jgi:hypothetical protein
VLTKIVRGSASSFITPDLELSESTEDLSFAENLDLRTVFRNDITSTNFNGGFGGGQGQKVNSGFQDYSPEYEYYDDEYEYYYDDDEETAPVETIDLTGSPSLVVDNWDYSSAGRRR